MARTYAHARLLALPGEHSLGGGRLDDVRLEQHGPGVDLVLDCQALELSAPPVLSLHDGQPEEQVQGSYHPRRLRFVSAALRSGAELGAQLATLPPDHSARLMSTPLQWRTSEGACYYSLVFPDSPFPGLHFTARRCVDEPRAGAVAPAAYRRAWSPPPVTAARRVPNAPQLRARYGGDPITVHLAGRPHRRRLFIGGLDTQPHARPDVDCVLNVGEEASRWVAGQPLPATDRWETKGEGRAGMRADEIAAEARWVAERVGAGKKVLVHCAAGMNRSATISCGVLILLEGLSAAAALERVREHHPWARPDSLHWLALRWLAQQTA